MTRLLLLGTGGTIAATSAHALKMTDYSVTQGIDAMLASIPGADSLADVSCEQLFNIDSRAFTTAQVMRLARRISKAMRDPQTDGVVITHGTDTLEETAFFLHLTLDCPKPVVLVGAMRPASALGAEGPLNLVNALHVAASPASRGRGVLVAMNDCILAARHVGKWHTTRVDAFGSGGPGLTGTITDGTIRYVMQPCMSSAGRIPLAGLRTLPAVDIVYDYQDAGIHPYKAAIDAGRQGLVVAGMGNGSLSPAALRGCALARRHGLTCIRASRVPHGEVSPRESDAGSGLLAAHGLNPLQARIALRLALAHGYDTGKIAKLLQEI